MCAKSHILAHDQLEEMAEGRWAPDPDVPWITTRHHICDEMPVFRH